MTTRVLFTRGFSSVAQALHGSRLDMTAGEFELHASYYERCSLVSQFADCFHLEPEIDDEAYVAWVLGLCAQESIDIVWPQSRLRSLLRAKDRLEAQGVRWLLPVPDIATYEQLDDKGRLLAQLDRDEPDLPRPHYRVVRSRADFREARRELLDVYPGMRLCIKPTRATYGAGFRIIDNKLTAFNRWLNNDVLHLSAAEIEQLLESNEQQREFLLMEYLVGTERSLDCLSDRGELIICIARHKGLGRCQQIKYHAPSIELARRLCRRFNLHGVINIQSRERILPSGVREACVLEINPRLSGGIDLCRAAGFNLPLAALRMAAGTRFGEPAAALHGVTYVGWMQEGCRISTDELGIANACH
ncbi:MAG TPA: ATP-grasp domain-containing protein [Nitrococcus sp.]|nr:ATP-grasp domain-containing protein [Nitrococcus sp.]